MSGWWEGPMCGFDLETTDKNPEQARIVVSCTIPYRPGRKTEGQTRLVNPGVPIPAEATAIHGIDDAAALLGTAPAVAIHDTVDQLRVARHADVPVVGMNLPYDFTVLDREVRRHRVPIGLDWLAGGPIIDIYVLDKEIDPYRRGGRKLTDLCSHYGVTHNGAHNATYDVLASLRVAWKIGRMTQASHVDLNGWYRARAGSYHRRNTSGSTPFLHQMQALHRIGKMDLGQLHQAQIGWKASQAASLQEHLRRTDPTTVCDPSWPVRPWTGEVHADA